MNLLQIFPIKDKNLVFLKN